MLFDSGMDLLQFANLLDEAGRAWSPFLERGEEMDIETTRVPSPHELTSPRTPEQAAELDRLTQRFYNAGTPDLEGQARATFLTRFNITPDDPRWAVEQERLMGSQRGVVQLGTARRLTERYETISATRGQMDAMTEYICEGDNPCEECIAVLMEGSMTLGERIERGLMPGDKCLGNINCQCGIGVID